MLIDAKPHSGNIAFRLDWMIGVYMRRTYRDDASEHA
jgi:hypothetical protein